MYGSHFLRNASIVVPLAVFQMLSYSWFNHRLTPDAHTLPLTVVDRWIPFSPWTVWPYLGLAVSALLLPMFIRQGRVLGQVLIAYALAMGTTFLCFAIYPTMYVRPAYASDAGWTGAAFTWLMAVDSPLCCFPSGHVITPALGCWGLWRDGRRSGMARDRTGPRFANRLDDKAALRVGPARFAICGLRQHPRRRAGGTLDQR